MDDYDTSWDADRTYDLLWADWVMHRHEMPRALDELVRQVLDTRYRGQRWRGTSLRRQQYDWRQHTA